MSLKRLKKQSSSSHFNQVQPFKVAVFGLEGVGKTAFIVRFATSKFIGEYDKALEYVYQCSMMIPPAFPVFFEILDTCCQEENSEILIEKIKWADAFVLIYSVTDPASFSELHRLKFNISHHTSHGSHKGQNHRPPIAVVGNKKDIEIERMVSEKEGRTLAESFESMFFEISVRESADEVTDVFEALYKSRKRSAKLDLLSRTKSNSYLELPMVHHHFSPLPTKKNKSFKHINKFPRIQGSPEMRRAFRDPQKAKCSKLSTDSDTSGDERHIADKCKKFRNPQNVTKRKWRVSDIKDDFSFSSGSSDDSNVTEDSKKYTPSPITEDFAKQLAEDFQKKTVLLTLN